MNQLNVDLVTIPPKDWQLHNFFLTPYLSSLCQNISQAVLLKSFANWILPHCPGGIYLCQPSLFFYWHLDVPSLRRQMFSVEVQNPGYQGWTLLQLFKSIQRNHPKYIHFWCQDTSDFQIPERSGASRGLEVLCADCLNWVGHSPWNWYVVVTHSNSISTAHVCWCLLPIDQQWIYVWAKRFTKLELTSPDVNQSNWETSHWFWLKFSVSRFWVALF